MLEAENPWDTSKNLPKPSEKLRESSAISQKHSENLILAALSSSLRPKHNENLPRASRKPPEKFRKPFENLPQPSKKQCFFLCVLVVGACLCAMALLKATLPLSPTVARPQSRTQRPQGVSFAPPFFLVLSFLPLVSSTFLMPTLTLPFR